MLLITEKSISISTAFDGLFFLFWALFNVNNSTGGEKNLKIELISNKKTKSIKNNLLSVCNEGVKPRTVLKRIENLL